MVEIIFYACIVTDGTWWKLEDSSNSKKPVQIGGGYFVPSVPVGDKRGGEFQNGEVQVTNNHVSEYAPSRGHVTTK
jgi:hypothetical protein